MDAAGERQILRSLLAALESPQSAAALAPGWGDEAAVLAIARHHRLTPLLDLVCGEALPGSLRERCRHDRVIVTARNLLLATAAEECLVALGRRGVEAVLLKGLAYEPFLYRETGCRPTGDVDIMVRAEHRRLACEVLADVGFEPKAAAPGFDEADYHEIGWTRAPVSVDLHLALAPLVRCTVDYREVWGSVRPVPYGRATAFLLAPPHAAVFHAIHMAIDHFDVPAVYLVDLSRLLPTASDVAAAGRTAKAWRSERALTTSLALAADFLPRWAASALDARRTEPEPRRARRVVEMFGPTTALPRPEQLRRKLAHLDTAVMALRYVAVQARRHAREAFEQKVRRRSPRERLGLAATDGDGDGRGGEKPKT